MPSCLLACPWQAVRSRLERRSLVIACVVHLPLLPRSGIDSGRFALALALSSRLCLRGAMAGRSVLARPVRARRWISWLDALALTRRSSDDAQLQLEVLKRSVSPRSQRSGCDCCGSAVVAWSSVDVEKAVAEVEDGRARGSVIRNDHVPLHVGVEAAWEAPAEACAPEWGIVRSWRPKRSIPHDEALHAHIPGPDPSSWGLEGRGGRAGSGSGV